MFGTGTWFLFCRYFVLLLSLDRHENLQTEDNTRRIRGTPLMQNLANGREEQTFIGSS